METCRNCHCQRIDNTPYNFDYLNTEKLHILMKKIKFVFLKNPGK